MRRLVLITTSVAALLLTGVFTSASAQSTSAQPSDAQPMSAGVSASSSGGSGEGPGMAGMTASGTHRTGWPWYSYGNNSMNCVGPISFCNVYFGGG
ncbi:hypothetical protein [Paraburkholderia humisilvae]|uniref:Uncharacterized protein n=1 Tax=Paraburkholderia humisilvae TaxID=627669 RepID=A0A6J5D3S8_9BURK|nr:hypothetical protein [Paraburkholderia humisilvae]CAB3748593.1 hypothetical protein LMG29542_00715 [Paraburkholderia humisilvae]